MRKSLAKKCISGSKIQKLASENIPQLMKADVDPDNTPAENLLSEQEVLDSSDDLTG